MSSQLTSGHAHLVSGRDDNAIRLPPLGCPPTNPDPVLDPDSQFSLNPRRLTARLTLQNGKGKEVKDSKDSKESKEADDRKESKESKASPLPFSPSTPTTTALDPLGTQILLRTNTANDSLTSRLRSSGRSEGPTLDDLADQNVESAAGRNGLAGMSRDRSFRASKGTSFFSRLTMLGKRHDDIEDFESDLGDSSTDISSFPATTSVTSDGAGYIPLHKQPPRYVRVRPCNTKSRRFGRLFLAQELSSSNSTKNHEQPQGRMPATAVGTKLLKAGDAIWAAEFSIDGRYLAVAGKDHVVRVFAVITTPEERKQEEEIRSVDKEGGRVKERLDAPVFRSKPIKEFKAHTNEILALCWSKNNFLLSASMDKTVQLWHISREESLATLSHDDLVTSIAFHPSDDRFFLSGSLDGQLRLWSIPDKKVAYSNSTHEFITAVAFSPDGKTSICGVLSGLCWFFDTEGLKYQFKIHVRSSRGKNAKGSKITGIKTVMSSADVQKGEIKVLISSNDSRIRIYNLRTRMLEVKLKGPGNQSSQIHARFSDDGAFVISGSEDQRAYIWSMKDVDPELKDRQPYETFDAHPEVVTTALMAPSRTRQLLAASGDPIYDLCNPPPVLLQSLDEATVSPSTLAEGGQADAGKSGVAALPSSSRKPEENSGYVKRCLHPDGNIIVTTDRTGTIKVFRQDCAFQKRQLNQWDIGSKFPRVSGIGRSGSIITRASGGSARTSISLGMTQAHHPSDRIISWRQDIDQGQDRATGTLGRSEQPAHPGKLVGASTPVRSSSPVPANRVENQSTETVSLVQPVRVPNPVSPSSSIRTGASFPSAKDSHYDHHPHGPTYPPTPSFSLITADDCEDQDKGDWNFWSLGRWGGGLSKLRYSMGSPPTFSVEGVSGSGSGALGESLRGNRLEPVDKTMARRSMGTADMRKARPADDENRRNSYVPTTTAGPLVEERGGPASAPAPRQSRATLKKRTDSGVGRLSAESGE